MDYQQLAPQFSLCYQSDLQIICFFHHLEANYFKFIILDAVLKYRNQ